MLPFGRAWLVVPVCAVMCGLAGGLFRRILILFAGGFQAGSGPDQAAPVAFAMVCGLGVALCGLVSGDHVYGTEFTSRRGTIIHSTSSVDHAFGPLEIRRHAAVGDQRDSRRHLRAIACDRRRPASDLSLVFTHAPIGALVLIGMVSYLTGVVQAPITSFVITSEMTNDHAMVIPLMAAALIANAASKMVVPEGPITRWRNHSSGVTTIEPPRDVDPRPDAIDVTAFACLRGILQPGTGRRSLTELDLVPVKGVEG